jgi:hypothetical protein
LPHNIFAQTAEFARKVLGVEAPAIPVRLHPERKQWAIGAFEEEIAEYRQAETIEEEADALIDLITFAAGRFHEMGLDGQAHCDIVHAANMLKEKGTLAKRPGSRGFDAIKPEGWTPPDHVPLIKAQFPKIILLGHARHGKDTVAELLRDRWGFQFQSSSMFCAERVMMPYFQGRVPGYCPEENRTYRHYATAEECYEDRVNFRDVWYDQISAYNEPDKDRLCRELFAAGNDIYVGMRAADEFKAAQKHADLVVWVDASGRGLPPEDASSCTVTEEMSDFTLYNNGTLEDLEMAVDAFVSMIEKKTAA